MWLNDTAVRVTWEPLTLIEARGFITNYTVTLQPQGSTKRADGSIVTTVPHNISDVIVTDLDPKLAYSVSVSVGTVAGQNTTTVVIQARGTGTVSLVI